jgi:predicted nucleic acid-binding protein
MKFSEIVVPKAVWQEVVVDGKGKPGAKEVGESSWIKMKNIKDKLLVRSLSQQLDDGESEAIALAIENGADLVLLDERDARETAETFGLELLGTIGILIWAKKEGHIRNFKAELDRLIKIAGFWISRDLYKRALVAAGE